MKLWRGTSFWSQPWFLAIAIVAGQLYGVWWMSLGAAEPIYVPAQLVASAELDTPFSITITAPALPSKDGRLIRATN